MALTLEEQARALWRRWGSGVAFYGRCHRCKRTAYVRGKSRRRVLCLECFDLVVPVDEAQCLRLVEHPAVLRPGTKGRAWATRP